MRRSAVIPLLALLLSGCGDMLFYRAGQDYFPLIQGSMWKYVSVGDDDTSYVEVAGDSSIGGQSATVVNVDFVPQFWLKGSPATRVERYFSNTLSRGGTIYSLEAAYGLVYLLPVVAGDSWSYTFENTVVVQGVDTLDYEHTLVYRVAGIEDIDTPAGSFSQCYRLERSESYRAYDTTFVASTEWLAPGVGLVRRVSGTEEQVLADYRIGP